jgi:uncharacterized GH25 family protein
MFRLFDAVAIAATVACAPAMAHEFWLEPSQFTAVPGARVAVRLCVGDGYEAQSLRRDAGRIEEFVVTGFDGTRDVVGLDGSDPAGFARFDSAGAHVIAYRSNRAYTEQSEDKFEAYLREDGLEAISAMRAQQERREVVPVRESYSRYAKALVRSGDTGFIADRRIGLPLELLAESNSPTTAADAGHATFQLLHQGRPLAGALVKAMRLAGPDAELASRTDADGRASFALGQPGLWRISAVHMTRAPDGVDAEWDSLWASLTFESGTQVRGAHCANRVAN